MKRRSLLAKTFGALGSTLFASGFPSAALLVSSNSKNGYYPCTLVGEIPEGMTKREYIQKKYSVYSFSEIEELVANFKSNGQLVYEHRILDNSRDSWFATFRSRQDYRKFIQASQSIGLNSKTKTLSQVHGLNQYWILPG